MRSDHQQGGSSLFEVLVSVLMLGLGIVGVAAVHTRALHHSVHAFESSQAAYQGQAMVEIMRSRRAAALAGHYHTGGFVCAAQASHDLGRWLEDLQQVLGETACADIACPSAAQWCKVTIRWGAASTQTGAPVPHEFSIGARL